MAILEPAAQQWCREQLLRQYPQWQVLEPFLPATQRDAIVLLQGVITAMLQIALHPTSTEVALHRLGWWVDALQSLERVAQLAADRRAQALASEPGLQHPALRCLLTGAHMTFLQQFPLTDWCHDLHDAIELQGLQDSADLRHWCWRLARPLDWLDAWLLHEPMATRPDPGGTPSVHARRLLLQQINTLPQRNWLYRNLPLAWRARHQLQVDIIDLNPAVTAGASAKQKPLWDCPGALLQQLLAIDTELGAGIDVEMDNMSSALRQQTRFWQAANQALAQALRNHGSGSHRHAERGIGPGLVWSCWRIARSRQRQGM